MRIFCFDVKVIGWEARERESIKRKLNKLLIRKAEIDASVACYEEYGYFDAFEKARQAEVNEEIRQLEALLA